MHIHKIKITNFRSFYGTHEIDFDNIQGLVKLSGPIGSGKTTIGEAVLCALFGKVKDHTNPNMIAWGTDTYELEMDLTSKGHQIHLIRNPKKQLEVTVDGNLVAATGKNDMQTILEEYYDVPRLAIEKMCIINFNGFSSLASLTPYETKTFLDDIFGFKTFTQYNDEVILERKEEQTKLTSLNAVLQETKQQQQYLEEKKRVQQEELRNSVDITGLDIKREKLIQDGLIKKEEYNNIANERQELRNQSNEQIRKLRQKQTEAATLGKVQKDNYNKFKEGKCPTCGHAIDQTVIDTYKQKMESYAADWKHYEEDIKKVERKYNDQIAEKEKQMAEIQTQINNIKQEIANIDSNIKIYNNNLQLINENYDDLIQSYVEKQKTIEQQISESDNEISEWNELNELFSKTLRYNLLDTLIPHINASIQYYITKLEQGYRVVYDQEFKAHIYTDNIDGEISYKDLSTGQKKTLDIAIIFGILQNLIANVEFNICVLDELMSNMDTDARNTMLSVIRETLTQDRTVFVINHAEMNDDFFDHKIRVRLTNKRVQLLKKRLKKVVDTGSNEIIAKATTLEYVHFNE